jgi:hypothetical protein
MYQGGLGISLYMHYFLANLLYIDKKIKFSSYKEIQSGAVAKCAANFSFAQLAKGKKSRP